MKFNYSQNFCLRQSKKIKGTLGVFMGGEAAVRGYVTSLMILIPASFKKDVKFLDPESLCLVQIIPASVKKDVKWLAPGS